MTDNLITWNAVNWITVLIMVAVGFTVLGFAAQAYKSVAG